jgi:23S rRNA (adenine2503-C2)-methyltransferase
LHDGNTAEAVSIPSDERVTGCVSSQVGCKFACAFCASGALGFKRNLTVGEILDEVAFLRFQSKAGDLTHIVFMGMGEPMDNYDNVLAAIRIINAKEAFHIGARRITISTSGVIPGIARLAREGLQVELSVSLHAAQDALRSKLMPVNKKYPLKDLIAACRAYITETNRQVTFEYTLIDGVNASIADAQALGKLLAGMNCKVNLIPINAVSAGFTSPGKLAILFFQDQIKKCGIPVTIRRSRGQDISAACGQLRFRYEKGTSHG